MDNWLELERRFREFASREPEVRLLATEGDDGVAYLITYFKTKSAERELNALASHAGRLLHEAGASRCSSKDQSDLAQHWWRYLKNNSRDVFLGSHGYSRQSSNSEPRHHQTGLLQNVGAICASECAILHGKHPVREKLRFLKWLHQNYIAAIIVGIVSAVATAILLGLLGK